MKESFFVLFMLFIPPGQSDFKEVIALAKSEQDCQVRAKALLEVTHNVVWACREMTPDEYRRFLGL